MKKVLKYVKFLILLLLINQIIVLISNESIRKGWWKSNGGNTLSGHDVLTFDSNLKWNVITQDGKRIGIVQLYIGKKLLISNMTLTDWFLYEHKG